MELTRRDVLLAPSALAVPATGAMAEAAAPATPEWRARWIWYPEQRTLQNSLALFRKTFELNAVPAAPVPAWVSGNSRYKLWVNGKFVTRGPAPCDPRHWDVDPFDLAPYLRAGRNVIAAAVLYYGGGDGTWVPSAPLGSGGGDQGFLFQSDGPVALATDGAWKTLRPRSWKHGNYQRWFLRSLQEEFDARTHPGGWEGLEFDDAAWRAAAVSRTPPGRPNVAEMGKPGWPDDWRLVARTIPPIRLSDAPVGRVAAAGWIDWKVAPEEYFECFPPDSFAETVDASVSGGLPVRLPATGRRAYVVTFDLGKTIAGHPYIALRAPAGTVVEILFCEMQTEGKLLLRTRPRYGQWVRVTCREGETAYEAFDYDVVRYLQLHVRNAAGPVEILRAGVTARDYAYAHEPDLRVSDAAVQRALNASLTTQRVVSQETLVDNVTRERQQYAGDLDQAKLASYYAFGETAQPARMLRTFAQGQSPEGWFMDSWPAWDRCQRLYQRHLGTTGWGTIIDHGLQFGIAAAEHHLWTGDAELAAELAPKLAAYDRFLQSHVAADGLLPVEGWVWNSVWIDHIGFLAEADKHAALNIYWAGYLKHGLAPILQWTGRGAEASAARSRAATLERRCRELYWSDAEGLFIDNLPRAGADKALRVHARTLAMALLFGAIPAGREKRAVELMASFSTKENASVVDRDGGRLKLGFNYPLNDLWRLWALGRAGQGGRVVAELRERYPNLPSVLKNGTFAEFWEPRPSESGDVWCQSNPVPVAAAYQEVLGIRPVAPGFAEYEIRPQPGDLAWIEATVRTPRGALKARAEGRRQGFGLRLSSPAATQAWLVVPDGARVNGLPAGARFEPGRFAGTRRAGLPVSSKEESWTFDVQFA